MRFPWKSVSLCLAISCSQLIAQIIPTQTKQRIAALPLYFEQNRGQAPTKYDYISHRDGLEIGFLRNGIDLLTPRSSESGNIVHLILVGGEASPQGEDLLQGHSNYLRGSDPSRWIHGVADYGTVNYNQIYPGISLSFYGNGSELEHDFQVEPGADPAQIAFRLDGAEQVNVTKDGDLQVHLGKGIVTLRKPVAYQQGGSGRVPVDASFQLGKDGKVSFRLGHYDGSLPLIIDPVFTFSTYLAGTGTDIAEAVTTDQSGNIYVTGYTTSTDFPTSNPEQPAICQAQPGFDCQNAFISKLDPTGKTLIYSTYLGGSNQDLGFDIQVDSNGNAIIAGIATSSNFPQAGAIQAATCGSESCYFLASLQPDGSALNYSGIIHGSIGLNTNGHNGGLALDTSGAAYLAGDTADSTFPTTPGTFSTVIAGYPYNTMFVMKVDATGELIYSTAIPGNAQSSGYNPEINQFIPGHILVDSLGQVTVSGTAGPGLPTTAGVIAPDFPVSNTGTYPTAGYVLQFNATASALNFSSYLPGTDSSYSLAVASNGNLYLTGFTAETNLPVSSNAFQKTLNIGGYGGNDSGYILELNANAESVVAATYLNGSQPNNWEETTLSAIALDSAGNVLVGGSTGSPDFPLVDPFVPLLTTGSNVTDALVLAEMSSDLSSLLFGSFLSSTNGPPYGAIFSGLAVDQSNNLVVAGSTSSLNFPATSGSFEPQPPPQTNTLSFPQHAFVSKINLSIAAPSVCLSTQSVALGTVTANASASTTLQVTNCGNAPLTIASLSSSAATVAATQNCGAIAPASVCSVSLTYSPIDSTAVSGTLTLSDNAAIPVQTVGFTGQGSAPKIVAQPSSVSFGHMLVGTQSPTMAVAFYNKGNAPLTISSIATLGSGFSIFASYYCTSGQIAANGFCDVILQFSPQNAGSFSGTLVFTSNDPVNPTLAVPLTGTGDSAYAVPVISSIGAGTFPINSSAQTVTVVGSGFYPQSVVQVNGVPQSTTYQSGTVLQATIAAASLTTLGELPLTVVNPTPGGGISAAVTITPYQALAITPSAIVSVPSSGLLYAAIPASATSNPNTVIPINPTTGALGTPIPVGKNPVLLAASDDGMYLYVALAVDQTVQRINLQTDAVERTFPYGPNPYCSTCGSGSATDMHVVPGNSQQVVLAQGNVISLYDDTGLISYAPSSYVYTFAPTFDSFAIVGSSAKTVYALPFTTIQNPYFTLATLGTNSISYTPITVTNYGVPSGVGNQVITDGTLLYTSGGEVWNPAQGVQVGSFASTTYYGPSLGIDSANLYGFGDQSYNYGTAMVLSTYALGTYQLTSTLAFTQLSGIGVSDLLRWGTNGFAFLVGASNSAAQNLYLTRSSISTQPAPTFSLSLSPASLSFGNVTVGSISPVQGITVTNTGTGTLTLSGIPVSAPFASTASTCNNTMAPGASCTISIAYAPTAVGASTGTMSVVSNGNSTPVSVTLTGTGASAALVLSPNPLNFGSVTTGTTSATQVLTVKNNTSAAVPVSSITIPAPFVKTASNCGPYVPNGAACTITLAYRPTAPGTSTGTLVVVATGTGSPFTASLTGSATPAIALAFSPTSLNFGSVTVGSTSATQILTVKNLTSANVPVSSITIPAPFVKTASNCGPYVPNGAACTITLAYKPTIVGTSTGTLVVTATGTGSPFSATLTGIGASSNVLVLSPISLDFGSVIAGSTSATQVLTVKNLIPAAVPLSSITFSAPFVRTATNCGPYVPNGAVCTITLSYQPTAVGASNGTLVVTPTAGSPVSATLTGTGTPAIALALSPTSLDFGSVKVGSTSATQVLTVKNLTSANVPVSSITIPTPFVRTATNCGPYVPNGAACTITLAYRPTAIGTSNGTLVVTTTASGSPFSATLTGTGN